MQSPRVATRAATGFEVKGPAANVHTWAPSESGRACVRPACIPLQDICAGAPDGWHQGGIQDKSQSQAQETEEGQDSLSL